MKTWLGLVVFIGLSVCFLPARQLRSQEAADETAADKQLQAVKEVLEQSVEWYDVLPGAEAKVGLRPQIVLSWRNAVRTNTGAALLAIWTDQGRPDVAEGERTGQGHPVVQGRHLDHQLQPARVRGQRVEGRGEEKHG